mmetsp:Transcript_53731/g.114683  ORF Transcript_53731/g.114683 Transcript_53731/m.114683 type:complete len:174 (+) Transcript_53731:288-809(+)
MRVRNHNLLGPCRLLYVGFEIHLVDSSASGPWKPNPICHAPVFQTLGVRIFAATSAICCTMSVMAVGRKPFYDSMQCHIAHSSLLGLLSLAAIASLGTCALSPNRRLFREMEAQRDDAPSANSLGARHDEDNEDETGNIEEAPPLADEPVQSFDVELAVRSHEKEPQSQELEE